MSTPRRIGLALGCLITLALTLAFAPYTGQGFGGGGAPTPLLSVSDPAQNAVTPAAARIWIALGKPLSMPFSDETPLEDVLKYIQSATQDAELPGGVQFYVAPAALLEAEHTSQSPVKLNLESVPVTTSLKLVLDQLDWVYRVMPEGYIYITYAGSREFDSPNEILVEELQELRREVAELRVRVADLSNRSASAPAAVAEQPKPQTRAGGFQ